MNKKQSNNKKVLVAVSGGVDSATTTYLLQKNGYQVQAVHFVFSTDKNVSKVKKITKKFDIKLHIVDLRSQFSARGGSSFGRKKTVIGEFLHQYKIGNTPNPCVYCNRFMKFDQLIKLADKLNIKYVSTGHYAKISAVIPDSDPESTQMTKMCHPRLDRGSPPTGLRLRDSDSRSEAGKIENYHIDSRFHGNDKRGGNDKQVSSPPTLWSRTIMTASDRNKDQTYFLWRIKPQWLQRIIFPIGDYQKKDIKKIASRFKLGLEKQKESQEVCFMFGIDLKKFLEKNLPKSKPGFIKNTKGEIIGKHHGLAFYTIGQRAGLSSVKNQNPNQEKLYVIEKDIKGNILIVGEQKYLMAKGVSAKDINLFISIKDFQKLSKEGKLYAKIRYGAKSEKIKIIKISNKNIRARFLRSQRAITPGQSLVFYNNAERLLGGGVICK